MYCTFRQNFPPVPPVRNEQWRNTIYDSEMKRARNFYATFVKNFSISKCYQRSKQTFYSLQQGSLQNLKTIGACRESTGLVFYRPLKNIFSWWPNPFYMTAGFSVAFKGIVSRDEYFLRLMIIGTLRTCAHGFYNFLMVFTIFCFLVDEESNLKLVKLLTYFENPFHSPASKTLNQRFWHWNPPHVNL